MYNSNSIECFETTSQSHLLGSSSPTSMQGIFWYAVYMGNVVGGDWFSDDVMPANGLTEHEGGGRQERSLIAQCCSEVKWPHKVKPLPSIVKGD